MTVDLNEILQYKKQKPKQNGVLHAILRGNANKRSEKKATVKPPSWSSLFPFQPVWVFLSLLKGRIPPQMFKKDWGDFFWILWHTVCQT